MTTRALVPAGAAPVGTSASSPADASRRGRTFHGWSLITAVLSLVCSAGGWALAASCGWLVLLAFGSAKGESTPSSIEQAKDAAAAGRIFLIVFLILLVVRLVLDVVTTVLAVRALRAGAPNRGLPITALTTTVLASYLPLLVAAGILLSSLSALEQMGVREAMGPLAVIYLVLVVIAVPLRITQAILGIVGLSTTRRV